MAFYLLKRVDKVSVLSSFIYSITKNNQINKDIMLEKVAVFTGDNRYYYSLCFVSIEEASKFLYQADKDWYAELVITSDKLNLLEMFGYKKTRKPEPEQPKEIDTSELKRLSEKYGREKILEITRKLGVKLVKGVSQEVVNEVVNKIKEEIEKEEVNNEQDEPLFWIRRGHASGVVSY